VDNDEVFSEDERVEAMDATTLSDNRVLELRQQGRSFAGIANVLGYERPRDAWLAFNRALRRHPPQEQADLRRAEVARLQSLTDTLRARKDLTQEEQTRRLALVERMRVRLLTGDGTGCAGGARRCPAPVPSARLRGVPVKRRDHRVARKLAGTTSSLNRRSTYLNLEAKASSSRRWSPPPGR
jgi:hypothetical protein